MEVNNRPQIQLYSDGAAEPTNPGPAGFGVILRYPKLNYQKEFSKGFILSTNNRMELMGVIYGLEQLKYPSDVIAFTDSKYVVNAINLGWLKKWSEHGWKKNKTHKIANDDLWKRLFALLEKHNVTFEWVKGHNGHPENERCDFLAVEAANGKEKVEDEGFSPDEDSVIKEGDTCYECNVPLQKVYRDPYKKIKGKSYFEWYYKCPQCGKFFYVEEARRAKEQSPQPPSLDFGF